MYMCTCVHMIGTLVKFIYSFTPFKLATHEDNYTTLQCSYKLGHMYKDIVMIERTLYWMKTHGKVPYIISL